MSKKLTNIFLALILLAGAFFRLYNLSSFPPSLNWDEVSHGYNAYSILKTGKDEWGVGFPTIFRAFGDYKLPAYIYLTTLPVSILGLNALSVRLISALAGILSVLFTYLLAEKLFKNKNIALMSSLLMAIEPWGLFTSRIAVEANLALFFVISGIYFLHKSLKEKKSLILAALLLGLSLWSYNSARIFVPLILFAFTATYWQEIKKLITKSKEISIVSILIFLVFFIPMAYQLANPVGQARFNKIKIINDAAIGQIIQKRQQSTYSPLITRLLYNRVVYGATTYAKNYASYFTPEFMFIKGGSHYQFNIPGEGLISLANLPFYVLGILFLFKKSKKESLFVLSWMLLAPVAGSFTTESPHALRSLVFLPMPYILISLGLFGGLSAVKSKKAKTLIKLSYLVALFVFFFGYWKNYTTTYAQDYSWSWQYGHPQMVEYVKNNYDKYDKIVITKKYGEPHIFILFYWPWDPASYREDKYLIRFAQSDWFWIDGFDKFNFVNDWEIPSDGQSFILESEKAVDCIGKHCLLVTSPGNAPSGWRKANEINFLDGETAFEFYEN